jgi:2-amino-4-hydroxy-6-hydroxymethyldihydropteridine diphosphokinase
MVLIGLGGNLPDPRFGAPRRVLAAALAALAAEGVRVDARSSWYRSAPLPPSDQPWYVNAVARLATTRDPLALLVLMQRVERQFGRVRGAPNAARTVDLDLLDFDGLEIETEFLVLPHPRLHLRRFALVPLAEIAPLWRHPGLGLSAAELLAGLGEEQELHPLPPEGDDEAAG